jgi:outer membrane cobalamin receptor
VFTRQQIQQLGINTLEELMNHVPGYQSYRSDNGVSNYSARSRRIANGNREILILMDGQRLNSDALGIPTILDFSVNTIERIEFIRGPGSAIYGANAFLGVVNIITSKLNNVTLSAGNHHQQRMHINTHHEFNNGIQSSLALESTTANHGQARLYDPLSGGFADGHQQQTDLNSIYWRAHWGDWSLQARHIDFYVSDGYVLGNLSDNSTERDNYANLFAVNYIHNFNEQWTLKSRAYNSPYEMRYKYRIDTVPTISTLIFTGSDAGLENQLTWQQDSAKLLLGADFARLSISEGLAQLGSSTHITSSVDSLDKRDRRLQAIYAQWQNNITTDLSYIVGVRHDDYSDTTSHTSPRAGLIYQYNIENTWKLLYGDAFRSPARNEMYLKNNATQIGNPHLYPESAGTTELVWMQTTKEYYFSTSLFDTRIKDPVILSNTPPPRPFINAEEQHLSGIEMELKWSLEESWLLYATASHMIHSTLDVNPDAEDLASLDLIYTHDTLTLSMGAIYHGASRDADNSVLGYHELGGFTTWDGKLNYQITPEWNIYSSLRNLTHKRYLAPALQNNANIYGVPSTGREIDVGVRWSF